MSNSTKARKRCFSFLFGGAVILSALGCAAEQSPPPPVPVDSFAVMDANGDGKVTIEEFRTANPNMTEQAFVIVDKNGDKGISREEWAIFMEDHGRSLAPRRGAPMNNIPGDPLIPPPDSSDLPLARPPLGN